MAIFSVSEGVATKILPTKVGLERDIQRLFERNLAVVLDITFLASEYPTSFGGRMDTLGIDNNGSPVIIEFKLTQNDNVINQGLSYLRWLLDHKAEFETLLRKANITVEIDWASPRVICVAESYNKFDLDTADLLPMNIELYRYRLYENNSLLVEAESQPKVKISTSQIFDQQKERRINHTFKEKIQYGVDDHLDGVSEHTKGLFALLREKIIALDDSIIEESKAKYIAYKLTTNFVDVVLLKDSLKIFLNVPSSTLVDPDGIARDLTKPHKIGHWGNGDYEVKFERDRDIGKVMSLVQQSYEYNK